MRVGERVEFGQTGSNQLDIGRHILGFRHMPASPQRADDVSGQPRDKRCPWSCLRVRPAVSRAALDCRSHSLQPLASCSVLLRTGHSITYENILSKKVADGDVPVVPVARSYVIDAACSVCYIVRRRLFREDQPT